MKSSIIFLIFFIFVIISFVIIHEKTHKAVYSTFGIESSTHYNIFTLDFYTKADGDCSNECELAQSNVENLGYQLFPILLILGLGFFFIILSLEEYLLYQQTQPMNFR
ncbi:MAG: hypothetical protein AABY22_23555 [Nanoarchaeota archaeon]